MKTIDKLAKALAIKGDIICFHLRLGFNQSPKKPNMEHCLYSYDNQ